jgi:hypothetical protein
MGGVELRRYGYHTVELENGIEETRQRQESRYFPKSSVALLYKRTSKERRKGNPPTPNILSLYNLSATIE